MGRSSAATPKSGSSAVPSGWSWCGGGSVAKAVAAHGHAFAPPRKACLFKAPTQLRHLHRSPDASPAAPSRQLGAACPARARAAGLPPAGGQERVEDGEAPDRARQQTAAQSRFSPLRRCMHQHATLSPSCRDMSRQTLVAPRAHVATSPPWLPSHGPSGRTVCLWQPIRSCST